MLMERDVEKLGNGNLHLYAYKYISYLFPFQILKSQILKN